MKLLIGLGNPGKEYQGTRHNIGKAFIEYLGKHEIPSSWKLFDADVFVNQSGTSVKKLKTKYKVKLVDTIVVHDDLDIEFGQSKLSFGKDSGGHRGVQSVIDHLKSNKFWRLRIGTANARLKKMRAAGTVADFVLSPFTSSEREELKKVFKQAITKLEAHI